LIYINRVAVEIIFQDERYLVVLNVLVLNGKFGCGAFVFSCGFVLSKGPTETKVWRALSYSKILLLGDFSRVKLLSNYVDFMRKIMIFKQITKN